MKKLMFLLLVAAVGCKKKDAKSGLNTYEVQITSYSPLTADTVFYSFDYWFVNTGNNAIGPQYANSFNSLLTPDLKGPLSDSTKYTHRIYTGMQYSHTKSFAVTENIGFKLQYRMSGLKKDSSKKYWMKCPVNSQKIK